jgi:hypothetical protein
MYKLILTLAVLLATPAAADPVLKFPKSYAAWQNYVACIGEPFFHCDYTEQQCLRGIISRRTGFAFVGEVLAEDRTTVIAHVMRKGDWWFNFDTGATSPEGVRLDSFGVHDNDEPPNLARCTVPRQD